jgi:hypothetical protein
MSATAFGTAAVFAIPSAESGLIVHNITYTEKQDRKELRNHTGEVTAVVFYNEVVEVKLDATLPTTSPFSGTLASALTLANTIPDHLKGSATGGSLLIDQVEVTLDAEDFKTISIEATYWPNIASA